MMPNHAAAPQTTGRETTLDQPAVQVPEAELDHLAAALADLLLSWWRRGAQDNNLANAQTVTPEPTVPRHNPPLVPTLGNSVDELDEFYEALTADRAVQRVFPEVEGVGGDDYLFAEPPSADQRDPARELADPTRLPSGREAWRLEAFEDA